MAGGARIKGLPREEVRNRPSWRWVQQIKMCLKFSWREIGSLWQSLSPLSLLDGCDQIEKSGAEDREGGPLSGRLLPWL